MRERTRSLQIVGAESKTELGTVEMWGPGEPGKLRRDQTMRSVWGAWVSGVGQRGNLKLLALGALHRLALLLHLLFLGLPLSLLLIGPVVPTRTTSTPAPP